MFRSNHPFYSSIVSHLFIYCFTFIHTIAIGNLRDEYIIQCVVNKFKPALCSIRFVNMWSETSDEDIYITQSTFCQESDLGDVNDWLLDGLSADEQMLTDNVEKQKATAEYRFANPISDVEIQAKIGDAVPKSTK